MSCYGYFIGQCCVLVTQLASVLDGEKDQPSKTNWERKPASCLGTTDVSLMKKTFVLCLKILFIFPKKDSRIGVTVVFVSAYLH